MAVTYGDLYLDIKAGLKAMGAEAPELEARELILAATGKTREEFYRDKAMYAPAGAEAKAREMAARRKDGEPLAYIIGEWEFYGLTMKLSRSVLIPRQDTEVLAKRAIELAGGMGGSARILDLCCGCGCIGIAAAVNVEGCRVVMCDNSDGALRAAKMNVRLNGLEGRATVMKADALGPAPRMGLFDIICCNPPYVRSGEIEGLDVSVRDFEPWSALDGGEDGLDFYRSVSTGFKGVLRPGGYILYEVGQGQASEVGELLRGAGYKNIEILPDSGGIDRVVTAQKERI